jgi:hypothetical protein
MRSEFMDNNVSKNTIHEDAGNFKRMGNQSMEESKYLLSFLCLLKL